jgi:DNA-binding transcriptional MocR family regulator
MTIWSPRLGESDGPIYVAIADAIARDITEGVLPRGTRLPTHRDLALRLGVTVGTVSRGYAEAERRGLTVGEVGRGTFVRGAKDSDDFGWGDLVLPREDPDVVDMSLACPWIPPDGRDGRELARTLTEIAEARPLDDLLRYDAMSAQDRHRAAAAAWIARTGLETTPDRVVVTGGAQHAMTVILASLLRPGDTLLTGELTYAGLRSVAQMLGLRLRGVALDEHGIVPEHLDRVCDDARPQALYCVPTIQNPTGVTMPADRRQALAAVARKHGLIILEDEIHVAHDEVRIPPIAEYAPERTIHITTLSKWVTFGLRVGFVVAPERALGRIRSGVRSTMWMTPPLMVEVATRWLSDGTAERMAGHKLEELEARHELAREVLGEWYPECTHPHSLHLWVRLPDTLRSDECVEQARQRGVLLAGAEAFTVGREIPAAVRVSIAAVPERALLRRGLQVLKDILDEGPCCALQIL